MEDRGCPKKFKNNRNMKEHLQGCEFNPDRIKIYCEEDGCDFYTYQTKNIKRYINLSCENSGSCNDFAVKTIFFSFKA